DERPAEEGPGAERPATSNWATPADAWTDPSFGPWRSILFSRLPEAAEGPWHDRLDERQGQLLRQRHGRDGVQDDQKRNGLENDLPDPCSRRIGPWTIHRWLLQSPPATLRI